MSRRPNTQAAVDPAAHLSLLDEKIRAVPDKLVAVRLDLHSLCGGEPSHMSAEARQRITEACQVLYSAIADVVDAAHYIKLFLASEGGRGLLANDSAKPPRPALARKKNGKGSAVV